MMKKSLECKLEAAEMRMLRWSCGRILLDKIPNRVFRITLGVALISAKVREGRLIWFGHVLRRHATAPVRRVESLLVVGGMRRGRPRRTWEELTADRYSWRRHIRVMDSFFGDGSVVESLRVGDMHAAPSILLLGGIILVVDAKISGRLKVDVEDTLDGGSGRIEASAVGDFASCEAERNLEPCEGMVFDSEASARAYYDEYAGRVGFLTRVLSSRKSERDGSIISCGIGCRSSVHIQKSGNISNEVGEKRRDGCTAMLLVKKESGGRWVVHKFVRDHNHPSVVSLPERRPTSDEKDKRIQELTAELRIKKRLSAAYREQLLILMKDVENHNNHLISKVQIIRDNLTELEARKQELPDHKNTELIG
ncbi:hypothetical protein OROHE_002943 [Orobanche hederae]